MGAVVATAVHTCKCTYCHDFKLPREALRPGHIAFRFYVRSPASYRDAQVFLDGVEVTKDCIEACPGVEGFVVVYPRDSNTGGIHYCRHCHRHICTSVMNGHVEVRLADIGEVFA